jgi:hypothetical protein
VGLPDVAEYLNYFSTVAFSIVLFLIFKRLHFETPVALFAASAVFALPSYIAGARYPLSEATASLLQAGMVLSFLTARSSTDWKPYVCLIALTWCRAEFLACSLISIAYLSLMAPTRRTLWILLLLSFNHILLYTYYQWANLGHINLLRVPLTLGLLSPSIVLLGWLARRTFDRLKFRPLNVRRLLRQLKPSVAIHTFAFLVAFVVALDAIRMGHLDVLGAPEITGSRPRYSTVSLLVDSVGLPLIVLGIAGLAMSFPKIVRHIPIPLAIVLAPQLVVLVDMHATPSNPFYWTRRFHLLVYPMLLFGLATSAHFIFKRFRDAKLGVLALPLSLFFLSSTVHASQDFFERATKASFTRESLAQFHRSADRLPEDAIVVLRRKHGGYEAQQPLRAFHGLWSFVVWDDEHLAESVRTLSKTGRPVLVDTTLLSAAEQSHAADQVFELPVRISAQNHFILELMPATRVAAADPGSPMLLRTHE